MSAIAYAEPGALWATMDFRFAHLLRKKGARVRIVIASFDGEDRMERVWEKRIKQQGHKISPFEQGF